MDGAFFRQDVLQWLGARAAGYAIKVPFYRWLDLQQYIRAQPTWRAVAPGITGFVVPAAATPWGRPVSVAIYRKHVHHRATKNYQLDLFDPNDGHYEYSAVTSNLDFTLANLWRFACGRGNHEKTIAQLKTGLAFHTVPTMAYAANSAWQHLVVLVHNLLTNFQIETGATRRAPTRKRTVLPVLQTIQTRRFVLFNRAAQIVRPGGALRLRLTDNEATRQALHPDPRCAAESRLSYCHIRASRLTRRVCILIQSPISSGPTSLSRSRNVRAVSRSPLTTDAHTATVTKISSSATALPCSAGSAIEGHSSVRPFRL